MLRRRITPRYSAKPDPVTADVRWAVLHRDRMCVIAKYDDGHSCRDRWGVPHAPTDIRRLSIEHVKDALRMGRRAPSDVRHLVAICYAANIGVPSKTQRDALRAYLAAVA